MSSAIPGLDAITVDAATPAEVAALAAAMADPARRTIEVVDHYYTLCIPFYRAFLGTHWHTGFYEPHGPMGERDQWRMTRHIAQSVQVGAGDVVLDVGCGMGGPACQLAAETGARVIGLTPNATQLALARSHAQATDMSGLVRIVQGWAHDLPVADNSVDVVLFFESACHFPDRDAFFQEAFRVLRPGGRIAGEDWLAADGLDLTAHARFIRPVCDTWAIPELGTCRSYAQGMQAAGFDVHEAVDMRSEMALARGFVTEPIEQARMRIAMRDCPDPIRQLIMQGLIRLGQAVAAEAFTIGRFVAIKPRT